VLIFALGGVGGLLLPGCQPQVATDVPQSLRTQELGAGPPNVLIIVVDDAGFSDLGFIGSEILGHLVWTLGNNLVNHGLQSA
jgi:hypothetical protein